MSVDKLRNGCPFGSDVLIIDWTLVVIIASC